MGQPAGRSGGDLSGRAAEAPVDERVGERLEAMLPAGVSVEEVLGLIEDRLSAQVSERVSSAIAGHAALEGFVAGARADRVEAAALGARDAAMSGPDVLEAAFDDAGFGGVLASRKPAVLESHRLASGASSAPEVGALGRLGEEPGLGVVESKPGRAGLVRIGVPVGIVGSLAALVALGIVLAPYVPGLSGSALSGSGGSGGGVADRSLALQMTEAGVDRSSEEGGEESSAAYSRLDSPPEQRERARGRALADTATDALAPADEEFLDAGDVVRSGIPAEAMGLASSGSVSGRGEGRGAGRGGGSSIEREPEDGASVLRDERISIPGARLLGEDAASIARRGRLELHLSVLPTTPRGLESIGIGSGGGLPRGVQTVLLDRNNETYESMISSVIVRMEREGRRPAEDPFLAMARLRPSAVLFDRLRRYFERRGLRVRFFETDGPLMGGAPGEDGWLWTREGVRATEIVSFPVVRFVMPLSEPDLEPDLEPDPDPEADDDDEG